MFRFDSVDGSIRKRAIEEAGSENHCNTQKTRRFEDTTLPTQHLQNNYRYFNDGNIETLPNVPVSYLIANNFSGPAVFGSCNVSGGSGRMALNTLHQNATSALGTTAIDTRYATVTTTAPPVRSDLRLMYQSRATPQTVAQLATCCGKIVDSSLGASRCRFCDKMCCNAYCIQACESCRYGFCRCCRMVNYSGPFERLVCLDCNYSLN